MRNWSTDIIHLKKKKKEYALWKLEQMVNFGTNGKKISKKSLKKHWDELHLDPAKKNFLHFLLWPRKQP